VEAVVSPSILYCMRPFVHLSHGMIENMTSSVKPEVHNVSQRRQRRTEPRPYRNMQRKLMKYSRAVFELCERTDKQMDKRTNKHSPTHYNRPNSQPYTGKKLPNDLLLCRILVVCEVVLCGGCGCSVLWRSLLLQ